MHRKLTPFLITLAAAGCTLQTPEAPSPIGADRGVGQQTNASSADASPGQATRKTLSTIPAPVRTAGDIGSTGVTGPATELERARVAQAASARAMPQPPRMPMPVPVPIAPSPESRERYHPIDSNPVQLVREAPISTFAIDVDTGSYSNVRRMLLAGRLPPKDAVRVEEMINYFPYAYAAPRDEHPFAVHTQVVDNPWRAGSRLLRIGIKGEDRSREMLPPANLVFLVDVSGSMNSADKLPLLKSSLKLLAERLRPQDRISLVTYASGTQLVLPPTTGTEKASIVNAIDALRAGGSTAGASGIELAYRTAQQAFIPGGINRILLATDGDFNVGVTDFRQLESIVEERRKSGIALSTLGFGTGNYNEQLMERLADVGNGAYAYIDSLMEGHKVLVDEASSTLEAIAQDVKIQVEFNPSFVSEYRLIGYENRLLAREDFNNDRVDAGDIGAGHSATAIYEITPVGAPARVDPLRYGASGSGQTERAAGEIAYVKLRYKKPESRDSILIEHPVHDRLAKDIDTVDADTRFAVAVAGFAQLLRGGQYTGSWDWNAVRAMAQGARGDDPFGYRGEFLRLVDLAASLGTRDPQAAAPVE
ncbi:MAG TPA: VWA domain-containing protein [Burkholderiaceae bacterium]|nr:VWA domain-containing protein [Burkholderiaceae bacterium]